MATFPTTIMSSSDPAFALIGNVLQVLNAFYIVYVEGDGINLVYKMAKSIDGGATWISDVGGSGSISIGFSDVSTVTDGSSKIFLISQTNGFLTPICVQPFDTTTDTWGTNVVTTNKINGDPQSVLRGFYRASDAKVIVWSSARTVSGFPTTTAERSYFFLFDTVAHTFGAWIQCGSTSLVDPLDWRMQFGLQGNGSDVVMIFDVNDPSLVGTFDTVFQVLTAPSTVGAITTIQTAVSASINSLGTRAVSNGTTIALGINVDTGDPRQVNLYSTLVTFLAFAGPTTVHSTGTRCGQFAVCIVPGQNIVVLIDDTDNIEYLDNSLTPVVIGVFPFAGQSAAFLNSYASLPFIDKGSIAWFDPIQQLAFFGPIPPGGPNPPIIITISSIIASQLLGYIVLPDPSILCSFENKCPGVCAYVYDVHKSK